MAHPVQTIADEVSQVKRGGWRSGEGDEAVHERDNHLGHEVAHIRVFRVLSLQAIEQVIQLVKRHVGDP